MPAIACVSTFLFKMFKNSSSYFSDHWEMHTPVPVVESHHDVKGRQEQHEVKESVAVLNSVPFVVLHNWCCDLFCYLRTYCAAFIHDCAIFSC